MMKIEKLAQHEICYAMRKESRIYRRFFSFRRMCVCNVTENQILHTVRFSFDGDMSDWDRRKVRLKCQCGYEFEGHYLDAPSRCPQCGRDLQ
jgi:hypothetical protein